MLNTTQVFFFIYIIIMTRGIPRQPSFLIFGFRPRLSNSNERAMNNSCPPPIKKKRRKTKTKEKEKGKKYWVWNLFDFRLLIESEFGSSFRIWDLIRSKIRTRSRSENPNLILNIQEYLIIYDEI